MNIVIVNAYIYQNQIWLRNRIADTSSLMIKALTSGTYALLIYCIVVRSPFTSATLTLYRYLVSKAFKFANTSNSFIIRLTLATIFVRVWPLISWTNFASARCSNLTQRTITIIIEIIERRRANTLIINWNLNTRATYTSTIL